MKVENDVRFTFATVGEGGTNHYSDVWTVQKLLQAAGVPVSVDGGYKRGGDTAQALLKFQEKWSDTVGKDFGLPPANKRDPLKLLQPDDDWLLRMAAAAHILIPMPGVNDCAGLFQLHDWLQSEVILYEPKEDYEGKRSRSFWPIHGRTNLAIQLQRGLGDLHCINPGPIQINCTSYANIMLAVYMWGHLNHPSYNPICIEIGGKSSKHLSVRYQFKLMDRELTDKDGKPSMKGGKPERVVYFTSPEQIRAVVQNWEIYSMEIGSDANHGTGHHTILHNGTVYESRDAVPSATDRPLEVFWSALRPYSRWVYLFCQP